MNGKYSLTVKGQNFGPVEQKGYLCSILVREGDAWKTRMLTWNVTPPPAPAQKRECGHSAKPGAFACDDKKSFRQSSGSANILIRDS
jgi:hypothetical protein